MCLETGRQRRPASRIGGCAPKPLVPPCLRMANERGFNMFDATMNRSQFLRAAGVAGMAAAGLAATKPLVAHAEEVAWDYECDVLVAGSGTAGAPAAITAHDAGAEVLVVESADWIGGEMRRCGGGFAAAGSKVQAALGIEDNADDFYDYMMAIGGDEVDAELVRTYADNAAPTLDWIIDDLGGQPVEDWGFCGGDQGLENTMEAGLNIGTDPANYTDNGMEPIARCHWFNENPDDPFHADPDKALCSYPGGTGLWKTFSDALDERGIEILTSCALTRLVEDADGQVIGAIASKEGTDVRIKPAEAWFWPWATGVAATSL